MLQRDVGMVRTLSDKPTGTGARSRVHDAFVSPAPCSAALLCCTTVAIREALCLG
jgi:hypothetical protein